MSDVGSPTRMAGLVVGRHPKLQLAVESVGHRVAVGTTSTRPGAKAVVQDSDEAAGCTGIAATAVHRKEGPRQQGHQLIAVEVISDRAGPLRMGQERFGDTLQVVRGPRGAGPSTPPRPASPWAGRAL